MLDAVIKHSFLYIFIFLFSSSSALWGQSTEKELKTEEINLVVGIDKIVQLDFAFSANMNLGDDTVLKVQPDLNKQTIALVGIKPGSTSLTIKDSTGEEKMRYVITVTSNDQSKMVAELRELLGDIEGLKIGIKGGKVYVGGQIIVPGDIGKVATILDGYPDVLRMIDTSAQTMLVIAKKMQKELHRAGFPNVTVRVVSGNYWIEGVVKSDEEGNTIKTMAEAFLPDSIESLASNSDRVNLKEKNRVHLFLNKNPAQAGGGEEQKKEPPPKMIKISSQFVELTKDYSKVFGFKWAPTVGADGSQVEFGRRNDGTVGSESSNTFSAVISNLFPKIQSLKNAGYGRVIQSGMVITKDKQSASINKGTDAQYVIGTGESARISTSKTNFTMSVTPTTMEEENIELDMNVSVNMQVGQTTSAPIIANNSIKTKIIVKSKETAVLGGIVQDQSITAYDKNDPAPAGEGSGTSLFLFLRSKAHTITKGQFVVFVTPEIIQSASSGTEEIRKKFRRRGR